MAASIFSLFGEIFVDNDAANKAIDDTTKKGSSLGETFSKGAKAIGAASVAIGTAAVGAGAKLFSLANDSATAMDAIDKTRQALGMSVEGYQEWSYVLGQNGADISKLGTAMKTLSTAMDGTSKTGVEAMQKLGLSYADMNQEEAFAATVTALQSIEDETVKAQIAQDLFGKQYQSLMPLLNQTAEGTAELTQRAHDLGLVMSEESVDAGVVFGDTLDDLKKGFASVITRLGGSLMPTITRIMEYIISALPTIQGMVEEFAPILIDLAEQLAPVFEQVIDELLPVLVDIVRAILPLFSTLVSTVLPPLLDIITAIIPYISNLAQQLLPILLPVIQQLVPLITDVIMSVMPVLLSLLDGLMPVIMTIIQQVMPVLLDIITQLSPFILQICEDILPIIVDLINQLLPAILPIIESVLPPLLDLLMLIIDPLIDLLNLILPPLTDIIKVLANVLSDTLGGAFENLKPIIDSVTGVFDGLISFIRNVFSGNWEDAWESIKNIFGNIWEGVKNVFKLPINWIIDGLNTFIRFLNGIKIPDWVPGVGGLGVNIQEIPKLAKGGTVTESGTAVVGERGPELVRLSQGAQVVPLTGNNAAGGIHIHIDGATIMRESDIDWFMELAINRLKELGVSMA